MVEILNWSHNTWNSFFYTAVLHPCPDVRGLLPQSYMAWIGNSNLCICRLLWKNPTKFPSLSPSCTAELSLKKIQRQPWAEILWELLCTKAGMRQTSWGKKIRKKNSFQGVFVLGRCRIPGTAYLWDFHTAKKLCPFSSSPWNPPVARKYMEITANKSTWR